MTPSDTRGDGVNPHPGNCLFRFRELGELLYRWTIFRNGRVARHALGGRRERHVFPRIRIRVAVLTFQSQGQMSLVAVQDGLRRALLRGRESRRLLGGEVDR